MGTLDAAAAVGAQQIDCNENMQYIRPPQKDAAAAAPPPMNSHSHMLCLPESRILRPLHKYSSQHTVSGFALPHGTEAPSQRIIIIISNKKKEQFQSVVNLSSLQ